jgi:leucyl/phenylalanyl-tRNA--protein transferase
MLAAEKLTPVTAPLQSEARQSDVFRESMAQTALRLAFGLAYACHPKRVATLPYLIAATLADLARGGTRVPDPNTPASRPDTFAGVVRDLTPETFLAGLRIGFFPWCHCGPLKWWTREKRMVLFFDNHKLEKDPLRKMKRNAYTFTFDTAFGEVVQACAGKRARNRHTLTWITPRFMRLYCELHRRGHAHSFEIWNPDGQLVGGGFGVSVGRVFYSDSLFSRERDVSKIASSALYYHLAKWGYAMCDGRDYTPMQAAMGYHEIPRAEHERILSANAQDGGKPGRWTAETDLATMAEWVAGLKKTTTAASGGSAEAKPPRHNPRKKAAETMLSTVT